MEIERGLNGKGWAVVDNFLDLDLCKTMRNEAGKLYESNTFTVSKSTRWDSATGSSVYYDKHNVFSTQLNGGEQYYSAPRLHEYVVSMTRSLVPILSSEYPEASLSPTAVSNKLAVCTGNGSAYDKHYDNSGMEDTRKVTVLYYMNEQWRPECGGCFRIFQPSTTIIATAEADSNSNPASTPPIPPILSLYTPTITTDSSGTHEVIDIEPIADRLLVFWSDRLVHSVTPSEAPQGKKDHRYALTLWLTATTPLAIVRDDAEVQKHFG